MNHMANVGVSRGAGGAHVNVMADHARLLCPARAGRERSALTKGTSQMFDKIKAYAPIAYCLIAAAVFLDSLRFKFTNALETQVIFGKLDAWAASFGASGLFAQTGLFSQYVIGTAELLASALLLASLVPALKRLRTLGALIAAAVMTGAVSFHLFTPLGIDPNNDGGGLFLMAVVVWICSLVMVLAGRDTLIALARSIGAVLLPPAAPTTAGIRHA